jgi:hypothetical protein
MKATGNTAWGRRAGAACVTVLACCGQAWAQSGLYSNAQTTPSDPGLATGATTAGGTAAPAGMVWSEAQAVSAAEANGVIGFACHGTGVNGTYRFADDFVVPVSGGGLVWVVTHAVVYAYATDAGGAGNPFEGVNVRVWNGRPDAPGSAVVFGDTSTDRMTGAAPTNLLRTASTAVLSNAPAPGAPDSSRPVWALTVQLGSGVGLAAGTYWLDWQVDVAPMASAFCPPVTVLGQRAKGGAANNALQFRTAPPPWLDGEWLALVDVGKPASAPDVAQDLPFILLGTALTPACGPADIGGQGGVQGQDGVLDNNDFVVFIDFFFNHNTAADRGVQGGLPGADGQWDNNDFIVFIDQFFTGC